MDPLGAQLNDAAAAAAVICGAVAALLQSKQPPAQRVNRLTNCRKDSFQGNLGSYSDDTSPITAIFASPFNNWDIVNNPTTGGNFHAAGKAS